MGFVRISKRNAKAVGLLLGVILLAVSAWAIVEESTESAVSVPVQENKEPTDLQIGWPPIAHLYWGKGYLEFKSDQPTKAAKEFFNVYLKDLVDRYIAQQTGCREAPPAPVKKKPTKKK